jgi:hypothetical protein
MDLRTITARVLSEHSRDKGEEGTRSNLGREVEVTGAPVLPERQAEDAPLAPVAPRRAGVGVIPGSSADGIPVRPIGVDVNQPVGLRDVLMVDPARHASPLTANHHGQVQHDHRDDERGHVEDSRADRRNRQRRQAQDDGPEHERDGTLAAKLTGDEVPLGHAPILSAGEAPSPVNQAALSVNPVSSPDMSASMTGTPFIFDRGTQTVHLGPSGAAHGELFWALSPNQLQGPVYSGYHNGSSIKWHENPQLHEREAVQQLLRDHTKIPLEDPSIPGNEDDPDQFKLARRKRANKCATCGDIIEGADCPRCNWGGWLNTPYDNTQNPPDPGIDMHRGIQAKIAHQLGWEPGQYGKGYISGVYGPNDEWLGPSVQTWPTDSWDGGPAHSQMGGDRMCFTMDPHGNAEYHAWTETPDQIRRAHEIISGAEPRLNFTDPEEFKLGKVRTADYQGRTNWDTWNTELMIDNEQRLLDRVHKMIESGKWTTPEQLRDWALTNVVGPYNKERIQEAQEWNEIPKHDRLDHHYEDLKEKSPEAADLVNGLGFGPNVEDDEPDLIDPELVNWLEIFQGYQSELGANQEYEREQQRLQNTGLSWTTPGHDDAIQQMRDAMYRYHGAVPEEEMPPGSKWDDPRASHRIKIDVPLEHFKQWPGWPDNFLPGGRDTARSKLFSHRFYQAEAKARAELLGRNPNLTPEQLDELLHGRGAFRPDYIQPHFPGGKYDTKFNLEDPAERQILESDPTYQSWVKNGYPMSLSDLTWDTISAVRNGSPHPYTGQMQQALQQRGYTPEQIAQIMSRPQPQPPQPKQPDPSLDQPGNFYPPSDWEAPGGQGTFSRVIPQDRWRRRPSGPEDGS